MALAFVLLIGAGLLLASFERLLGVDPGFVAENVLTGRLSPLATRYKDDNALRGYTDRVLTRIRALPGVEAAGASSFLPFSWDGSSSRDHPGGLHAEAGRIGGLAEPAVRHARLLRGDEDPRSRAAASSTRPTPRTRRESVIVDENLARKFWPKQDPVGKRIYLPDSPEDVAQPGPTVKWMTVVGVVGEVKMKGLVEGGETARVGAFYAVMAQHPNRAASASRSAPRATSAADAGGRARGPSPSRSRRRR